MAALQEGPAASFFDDLQQFQQLDVAKAPQIHFEVKPAPVEARTDALVLGGLARTIQG